MIELVMSLRAALDRAPIPEADALLRDAASVLLTSGDETEAKRLIEMAQRIIERDAYAR
ncbi:hypothetical protein IG197_27390 [Aminobacter sp. SR38]|jgi:hypothetical protein|uniref:hypothetical protein n=1 Tax=Aminobacter sp. SR38 TaxID=2774562 RepID=UPI0017822AFF|nr:hypothetical protein [Aminobacter sp. SR38]QOF71426.1 hypothetical protein IG197_27390 [Aminobacter sp. SR38]